MEVAEHLHEKHSENFVELLTSLSNIILFSAAIPYQGGVHHVNEQPPKYWANLFREKGYFCFDILRDQIWNNKNIAPWYRQNILLFAKEEELKDLNNFHFTPTEDPRYLVVPELWEEKSKYLDKLEKNKIFKILRKVFLPKKV